MSFESCIDTIKAAAGRDLSDEELDGLLTALQSRQKYILAKGLVGDSAEAVLQAAEEVANNIKLAAVIERRNAAINLTKRIEKVAWVQKNFGNNIAEGLEAILVGVNRAKTGAREGVAQIQHSIKQTYMAGIESDLERTGHMDLFASGAMDRDVARALWAIGRDTEAADHARLPSEAVDIAKVVNDWQELSRLDANEAGAWIGKTDGYIVRQTHDMEKIRGKGADADYMHWRDQALQYFDIARMQAEQGFTDPEKMLRSTWINLASGTHLKNTSEVSGFKGPGNLAKKISQDRIIQFKDADSWFDYNQQFGQRNLREAVAAGLSKSADSIGLMRSLGTNPVSMFDTIKTDLIKAANDAGRVDVASQIKEREEQLGNYMKAVDGTMNIPGDALLARRAANLRAWKMMSSLGSMVFSQLNDLAVYGAGARYQGRGFFAGMHEAAAGLGRSLKPAERRELLSSLGVVLDNAIGEIGRVDSMAQPGRMAKAQQLFMKMNLGEWWVNHMRASAAMGMAHDMALQAGKTFGELNADFQRILSTYNIGEQEWNVIRSTETKEVDGKAFIVPENIAGSKRFDAVDTLLNNNNTFPDAADIFKQKQEALAGDYIDRAAQKEARLAQFETSLRAGGKTDDEIKAALKSEKASIGQLRRKGTELTESLGARAAKYAEDYQGLVDSARTQSAKSVADKLRTYLTDQTQFLALEPDAKTRAILLRGTQSGTKMGEFMRFVMQFKSFTGAYMQKILGRELFGRGYEGDSIIGALRNGNGELQGLAQLIVTSTLMGYASMQLKALAKGQVVTPPKDKGEATQQFLAAMLQGGGMGIYGDFLFGQASRFGGGMIETAAGPVISEAFRIADLYHKILSDTQEQGPTEAARRAQSNVFREVVGNTPFINLFYTKAALDYLLFYRIQEQMNPGYLSRAEGNAKKQQREFLVKPLTH